MYPKIMVHNFFRFSNLLSSSIVMTETGENRGSFHCQGIVFLKKIKIGMDNVRGMPSIASKNVRSTE